MNADIDAAVPPSSRRSYLKAVLGCGVAVGALPALSGCLSFPDEREGSSGERPVRRDVASLMQSDPDGILDSYRDAVEQMKNLPSSDPRSWANQAAIHGQSDFNECEHTNWLFLPWHRAYLFFFEDICRELSGNPDFALPYWNWIENPRIPSVFEGDAGNPLYDSTRQVTSTGAPASTASVGSAVIEGILGEPNFLRFGGGWRGPGLTGPKHLGGGTLESTPHNHIHNYVRGNMRSARSPLDPIFWLHHCMVDRLWWEWNATRRHPNTNDSDWVMASFGGDFVDAQGAPVDDVSVLRTLLMPYISYRYETTTRGEPGSNSLRPLALLTLPDGGGDDPRQIEGNGTDPDPTDTDDTREEDDLRRFLEEGAEVELELLERAELGEGVDVRVGAPVDVGTDVRLDDVRPYLEGEEQGRIVLALLDIEPPKRAEFTTSVFVDLPEATVDTGVDSPNYAGEFSFFVADEPDPHHRPSYFVDVTDALYTLYRRGEAEEGDALSFQFVAVPFEGHDAEEGFTIGRLSLDVTRSVIDGEVVERSPVRTDRDVR